MLLALRRSLLFQSCFEGPLVSVEAWWLFSSVCTCNTHGVELTYLDDGGFRCLAHGLVEVSGRFPVKDKCTLTIAGNIACYKTVVSKYTEKQLRCFENMQAGARFNRWHCPLVDKDITALSVFLTRAELDDCNFQLNSNQSNSII